VEGEQLYRLICQVLDGDSKLRDAELLPLCFALGRHLREAVLYIPVTSEADLRRRFLALASALVAPLQLQPAFAHTLLTRVLDAISTWIQPHHRVPGFDLRDLRLAVISALRTIMKGETAGAQLLAPLVNMVWYTHQIRGEL
jgi:hypothetical protein